MLYIIEIFIYLQQIKHGYVDLMSVHAAFYCIYILFIKLNIHDLTLKGLRDRINNL